MVLNFKGGSEITDRDIGDEAHIELLEGPLGSGRLGLHKCLVRVL